MSDAAACGGPQPVLDAEALLETYRTAAADIRRCLDQADIAAQHGRPGRAAGYLVGVLEDLAPELRALKAARSF
jgi:hypothetical protein